MRVGVLPDGAFAVCLAHVDRAGLVYATPWLLICRSQEPHLKLIVCAVQGDPDARRPANTGTSLLQADRAADERYAY